MTRAAVPRARGPEGKAPAGTSSETGNTTGWSPVAPRTSGANTAKPSMALLSHGGWSTTADTGSATARPSAVAT
jgi:hypothetical protein